MEQVRYDSYEKIARETSVVYQVTSPVVLAPVDITCDLNVADTLAQISRFAYGADNSLCTMQGWLRFSSSMTKFGFL